MASLMDGGDKGVGYVTSGASMQTGWVGCAPHDCHVCLAFSIIEICYCEYYF